MTPPQVQKFLNIHDSVLWGVCVPSPSSPPTPDQVLPQPFAQTPRKPPTLSATQGWWWQLSPAVMLRPNHDAE